MARSEQSTRAREIFESALDIASAEERAAYVKSACGGDAALLERVQALLQADYVADSFLPNEPRASRVIASIEERPGTVIGRYKLLEKIGEGGMGIVYMAEQEEPVRRRVALKIIKLGMDTRQVVARFEAERQALAMMDHPNIAKIYDAGMTGSDKSEFRNPKSEISPGRPYFVMELVQGVPITEFCDKNQLSAEERIKLFIPVCSAIQHAHQKGIIHRDLKPSNVLVTLHDGVPVPKVIDFGVAKAINQKLTEKTLFTNFGTMIGTPAYMSPEQAEMSGLDVDTRSDIYSLGVLLYELLTGTTPFPENRLRSLAYAEMQRIILEEEPERPSTRLRKTALTGSASQPAPRPSPLATDLDWIVMKCLEKDRDRRYETANRLVADIQAHLNNEPVVARPPSTAYRLQKMVRRNKLQCAAAAFVLLVLVVAVVVSRWQAVRATRAEQQARQQTQVAEREGRQAEAVKNFLLENLLGVDPYGESPDPDASSMESTKALLARVSLRMEGKFADQPRMEADIRMALAEGFGAVRNFRAGAPEAEKALAIRQQLLGPTHSNTLSSAALAAYQKNQLGQRQAAEQLLSDHIKLLRQSPQGFLAGGEVVLATYGMVLSQNGRPAEGLPYLREALEVSAQTLEPNHRLRRYWQGRLALATQDAGNWKEAEALWRSIIQQSQRDYGAEYHRIAPSEHALARFLVERNRSTEALPLLERVVSHTRQRLGRDHWYTLDSEYWLGEAYEQQKQVDRAEKLYTDIYPRYMKFLPNNSAIGLLSDIAEFFVRHRRFQQARAIFEALREAFAANPASTTVHWNTYVRATAVTKGWPAVAEIWRENFDRFSDSPIVWLNKAWIFRYVGEEESYQRVVRTVLALAPSVTSTNDQHVPIEIAALGAYAFPAEQVKQLDSMMVALEAALPGRSTNQQVWGYRAVGQMQLQLGRFHKCLEALDNSTLKQTSPDPYTLFIKAICLHRLSRGDEARAAFGEAEAIMKSMLPEPLSESEGFLPPWQIYQHVLMRREAQAVLADARPKL